MVTKAVHYILMILALGITGWTATDAASKDEITIQHRFEYLIDHYTRRIDADPSDILSMNRLGNVYISRARLLGDDADYRSAEKILRRSLAVNTSVRNLDASTTLAAVLLSQHRFQEGLIMANQVLSHNPYNIGALAAAGDALFEMGDLGEAGRFFRKLLRFAPGYASYSRMALLAQRFGDATASQYWFFLAKQHADQMDGEASAWVRVMLADLSIKMGEYRQARHYCREALHYAPDYYLAYEHIAETFERQRDYEAARPYVQSALRISRQPELLLRMAVIEETTGRMTEAESLRREARLILESKIASGDRGHLRELAHLLMDREEDPSRALRLAEQDAAIRGGYQADATLARALAANGAVHRARVYMNRALYHNPLDPDVYAQAAVFFAMAGDEAATEAAKRKAGLSIR